MIEVEIVSISGLVLLNNSILEDLVFYFDQLQNFFTENLT